jgi:hypothetical protein
MTKQEYENAVITNFEWTTWARNNGLVLTVNGRYTTLLIEELLIPMFQCGFIEGFKGGMFVVQKIDDPSETELVDVDAFMIHNVDMAFCEKILKYL